MKIGTDSILLGCLCEAEQAKTILDIGAGTGLLALMMAQRSIAHIDAVEIDHSAYEEAHKNIASSKWASRIALFHTPIQHFVSPQKYDLVITNPPYYKYGSSYNIEAEQRSKARHDKELPFDELCREVTGRLNPNGAFWLILPTNEAEVFKQTALSYSLYLQREILIRPKESKPPNRIVMCFGKEESSPVLQELFTIYHEDGTHTEEYYSLTKEFLLWKNVSK